MTDATNASRTMLFDIRKNDWDDTLLDALNIPRAVLPRVTDTSGVIGMLDPSILGRSIPVAALCGDQHSALFGQGCFEPGMMKNTYGTGCFLLMNTGDQPAVSQNGLVSTIAWRLNGTCTYALEGSVFVAGAAIQWLRDEMKIIERASETETIARSLPDNGGVYMVPTFTGLGAPYWDMYSRGTIIGLDAGDRTCACCPRGAGIHRVSIGRSGQRDGFRLRAQAVGTPRGRRREREPVSDAVSGGCAGLQGDPARR